MSNLSPSNPPNNISARAIDLSAEVKKAYGPEWNKPSISYIFSNGREFELQTQDAAIYSTSPDF